MASAVFVGSNPFMTARPGVALRPDLQEMAGKSLWERFDLQVKRRLQSSQDQKINFPHNALLTSLDKSLVLGVQGFGRFGLLGPQKSDSTVRFDRRQDWGVILWGPLVLYGLIEAVRLGLGQFARAGRRPRWLWPCGPSWRGAWCWPICRWPGTGTCCPSRRQRVTGRNRGLVPLGPVWCTDGSDRRRPALWVFVILFGSYAFFWHTRDWNTASRLMLTYALVDRGTVAITGLEQQTNDKAFFEGQYYSDKFPGFSLLATLPYAIAKIALRLPSHPLNVAAFPYWDADYWSTLGTSGLFTALTAVLLLIWGVNSAVHRDGPFWLPWLTGSQRRHTFTRRLLLDIKRRRLRSLHRSSCCGNESVRATRCEFFSPGSWRRLQP